VKCYCISGLGADKRAFKYLNFDVDLIHIEWIPPTSNETLTSYSKRLSKQIDDSEPFILLGLSFGGLVACEIASFLKPKQTILISSLTNNKELPVIFRLIGKTRIHNIIPHFLLKPPMFLAYWLFGVHTTDSKKLLAEIISDTDTIFLKWALDKLLSHQAPKAPVDLIRIHGTHDRLISAKQASGINWVNNGGHFMVIQKADQVNNLLKQLKSPSC